MIAAIFQRLDSQIVDSNINELSPEKLKGFLERQILNLSPEEIDQLAEEISLEELQEAVKCKYPDHITALETARQMFKEAQVYLNMAECTVSSTLKTKLLSILSTLLSILESILNAFGIVEFFRAPENRMDADFKSQKIMLLLSLFTMLSGIFIPLLGAELGALIIGGTLLTIAALSLIYPHIKPQSMDLPRGQNWTQQYLQGNLQVSEGSKETLDEIARRLSSGDRLKSHVMLIGKSGIGKTETAKAFVQAVERGDYPALQGKQIIYFNTAQLLGSTEMFSDANRIFLLISEAMGRHRDDYILIFDEIHMACKDVETGPLCEQLKTFLDPGTDKFPFVIGITTKKEYKEEILEKNDAFARRFEPPIAVQSAEDPETLKILNGVFLRQAPKTIREEGAFQYLLDKTNEAFAEEDQKPPQPAAALKILMRCVKRTADSQKSPLEKRVEKCRRDILNIHAQGAGLLPYGRQNNAAELEQNLAILETALEEQKVKLAAIFQDQAQLAAMKKATLKMVLDIEHFDPKALSNKEKNALNAFSLQSHFHTTALEARIRAAAAELETDTNRVLQRLHLQEEADDLKVKVEIDKNLIDEMIEKEKAAIALAAEQLLE